MISRDVIINAAAAVVAHTVEYSSVEDNRAVVEKFAKVLIEQHAEIHQALHELERIRETALCFQIDIVTSDELANVCLASTEGRPVKVETEIERLRAALKEALDGWGRWALDAWRNAPPHFDTQSLPLDRIAELRKLLEAS
jgi:hypothetical protein